MDVVDLIARASVDEDDRPLSEVKMEKVTIEEVKSSCIRSHSSSGRSSKCKREGVVASSLSFLEENFHR